MDLLSLLILLFVFLFSVSVHEVAHGVIANHLGDPTAKNQGRLTLNPLKHLDFFGSILVPGLLLLSQVGIIFGWAKPVPINLENIQDKRYGQAKVAVAGPLANLAIALFFGLLIRFALIPFAGNEFIVNLIMVIGLFVWVNLILAIFNLLPIPPLDGSHILFTFLPPSADRFKLILQRYGLFILLFVMFFCFQWIIPLVRIIFQLITGQQFGV